MEEPGPLVRNPTLEGKRSDRLSVVRARPAIPHALFLLRIPSRALRHSYGPLTTGSRGDSDGAISSNVLIKRGFSGLRRTVRKIGVESRQKGLAVVFGNYQEVSNNLIRTRRKSREAQPTLDGGRSGQMVCS
jgi:hypothetical protein